jgi:RNA polymerase sigma-70 factor, ECF subfamily
VETDLKDHTSHLVAINEKDFESVFKDHFKALHAYANVLLKDSAAAEEVVQKVFLKLWERKNQISINTSLKAYLYKSVYHESLNHLKHEKVKLKYMNQIHVDQNQISEGVQEMEGQEKELQKCLQKALNLLPEKCRAVFHLSRFEEMKYQEIAEQLQISIKTVETHMGKALKILRRELAEFLPVVLILFISQ